MRFWFFTFSILFTQPTWAADPFNIVGCNIYDMKGKLVRQIFSEICLYFPDGQVFIASQSGIAMYDREMNPLWKKPMYAHHQVIYDDSAAEILVQSAEIIGDARSDVAKIFDRDGNLKKEFKLRDLKIELKESKLPLGGGEEAFPNIPYELTHLNTFRRIPLNRSKLPALKKGNYLINDRRRGIFVLDSDLKKILWSYLLEANHRQHLHDVQILTNGNLLFYENVNGYINQKNSALEEFDPVKMQTVWRFTKLGENSMQGTVQVLSNNHVLYSTMADEGFDAVEITRSGKEVWRIKIRDQNVAKLNQVKRVDLTAFFKASAGP